MPPYIFKLIELVRKSVLRSPLPPVNIEALMVLPNLKVAPRKQGKSKRLRDVSLFSGGGGGTILGGRVIIFSPLVWERVTNFFKVF